MKTLSCLLKDTSGATAVEYGLLTGLIALGLIVGLQNFSDSLLGVLDTINEAIVGAG